MCIKYFRLIFLLVIIILLSSCGRNRRDENEVTSEVGPGLTMESRILTISAPARHVQHVQQAGEMLSAYWEMQGVHLYIDIASYMEYERDGHFATMLSKFAAGIGPDIFISDNFQLYQFVENGFLADINTIIAEHGNRDDFFTNVLEAYEVGGQLYQFPIDFLFDFIGINANVPFYFIERFAALDRATPSALIDIFTDLVAAYPEWNDFAFANGFTPAQAITPEIGVFIDFPSRTANLSDNSLADLLEDVRRVFYGNDRFGTRVPYSQDDEAMAILQERYVFSRAFGWAAEIDALFEYTHPWFVHYIPIANNDGQLVIMPRTPSIGVCISHTADVVLAWGFIEELVFISANANPRVVNLPISRRHFHHGMNTGLRTRLQHMTPRTLAGGVGFMVDQAVARLETYGDFPVAAPVMDFLIPPTEFDMHFDRFITDEAHAETTIQNINNSLESWINTPRPIEPFTPYLPEEDDDIERTVRTLSIFTSNQYLGILQQAADIVNADWLERGYPYVLELEFEYFSSWGWDDFWERGTGIRTRLMAGLAPDIIMMQNLWSYNIHALTRSGFLQDFYVLMDACPRTSRDEFFLNVLQAYEVLGRQGELYVFPVNFGFNYMGINSNIPQEFIDRVGGKSSISAMEIFEIYMDLIDRYPGEFDHMLPGMPARIDRPISFLESMMGDFIDFSARSSNLTDPQFINILETMRSIFTNHSDEYGFISIGLGGGHSSSFFLQNRLGETVFHAQYNLTNAIHAFFSTENVHFLHFMPFADSQGRLGINPNWYASTVSATAAISSTADGQVAWEFVRAMVGAFADPQGRALLTPQGWELSDLGHNSLLTPIIRDMFREHARRAMDFRLSMPGEMWVGIDTPAARPAAIERALDEMAALNEMPMVLIRKAIPHSLFEEPLEQFMLGLITAEAAAQRMQNTVALWLIE